MPLTCPLLLLFVLKLEDHLTQELEILYRALAQKNSEYLMIFVFSFFPLESPSSTPPPPPPLKIKKKFFRFGLFVQIHLLDSSKLELYGFTIKVIHIFCNVDCTTCFTLCRWMLFCILPLLTVWHTVLVSVFPPPPQPLPHPHFFSFQIWILCQNSLTRELKIRVVGFCI